MLMCIFIGRYSEMILGLASEIFVHFNNVETCVILFLMLHQAFDQGF